MPDPPGLLLLTSQQPASHGGNTLLADAARITATLAEQHPAALRALSAPRAAYFGASGGYLGPVCELAGSGRAHVRLRLDDLAMFSADAAPLIPRLRAVIAQHQQTIHLDAGQGLLVSSAWSAGTDTEQAPTQNRHRHRTGTDTEQAPTQNRHRHRRGAKQAERHAGYQTRP